MESVVRVGGSGYTTMLFQGIRLAYLQVIQDTPPTPVATAQAVQPIDEPVPLEIITASAVGVGTLRLTFYETWISPAWAMLPGLQGTFSLLDVLKRQLSLGTITLQKIMRSPSGILRAFVYHNCLQGETRYLTTDGYKSLRDTVGTEQKVLGRDGTWTPAEVKSFGYQPLLELELGRKSQSKKLLATPGHRWILPDMSETTTELLAPDQQLCTVDGAEWRVHSVKSSGRTEEVFCALVPDGQAFALEDDILTGNCVITDIDQGENINIGTMSLPKTITIQYTYTTPV